MFQTAIELGNLALPQTFWHARSEPVECHFGLKVRHIGQNCLRIFSILVNTVSTYSLSRISVTLRVVFALFSCISNTATCRMGEDC